MEPYNYLAVFLYFFNAILGVPGNCIILYVYMRKKIWNASHVFIFGLAVVDLTVSSIVLPMAAIQELEDGMIPNEFLCKFRMWIYLSGPTASLHMNTLVAFDRYFAVMKPHARAAFFRKRHRAPALVCAGIALSFVFNIPQLVWRGVRDTMEKGEDPCYFTNDSFVGVAFRHGFPTLNYVGQMILTVLLYVRIHIKVKSMSRIRPRDIVSTFPGPREFQVRRENTEGQEPSTSKCQRSHQKGTQGLVDFGKNRLGVVATQEAARVHLMTNTRTPGAGVISGAPFDHNKAFVNATFRMLFVVMVVFTSTWLIQFCLRSIPRAVIASFRVNSPGVYMLYVFFISLVQFNSSVPVFIYAFVNRVFRSELKAIWKRVQARTPKIRSRRVTAVSI